MSDYILQHAVEILHHIVVPVTDHAIAMRLDQPSPFGISFGSTGMLPTIQLDYQLGASTRKVSDCATNRKLFRELPALKLPSPQP
jgi:hypothetical protein